MTEAEVGARLDEHFTLSGDEDGGVGIVCRRCDLGGQPIAYYGWDNPYSAVPEVTYTRQINALITAALAHLERGERCQGSTPAPPPSAAMELGIRPNVPAGVRG